MVTYGLIGSPGESASSTPPTADTVANTIDSTVTVTGDAVTRDAAAVGVISNDNTSRAPMICTAIATVRPRSSMNAGPIRPSRDPAGDRHVRVDRPEEQRPPQHHHGADDHDRDDDEHAECVAGDRTRLPDQRAELVRRPSGVHRGEQHTEPEAERHHDADGGVPLPGPDAEQPEGDARRSATRRASR